MQASVQKRLFARAALVAAILAAPAVARPQGVDREDAVVTIVSDVYVVVDGLLRNPVFETGIDEPLFNVAGIDLGIVFYATFEPDSRNPSCPNAERLLPLTSKDPQQAPDEASFVADSSGEADFQARLDGCLLDAMRLQLVLIYHFDGQTYGQLPNRGEYVTQGEDCRSSFGADAMRQTLILQKTEG